MRPHLAFLLLFCFATAGCGPIRWSAVGADALRCTAPGIQAVVQAGVAALVGLASGGGVDYAAMGKKLALDYGPPAALCIVERGVALLGTGGASVLPGGESAPGSPEAQAALKWLDRNRTAWAD